MMKMIGAFPICLMFFTVIVSCIGKVKVAVCITGQLDRWLPEEHISNLVRNNPEYYFSFFFTFQIMDRDHPVSYHLKSNMTEHSFYSEMGTKKLLSHISEMYSQANSEFSGISFELPYSASRWEHILLNSSSDKLNRISRYAARQTMILNMYKNQVSCVQRIVDKERHDGFRYDYIIWTREDLVYFHPLNISIPIQMLDKEEECNLVAKQCLEWGGIAMRMEVTKRDVGIKVIGGRLNFYQSLYALNKSVHNPEIFEKVELESIGLKLCGLSVEVMGVTSGRALGDGKSYCFLSLEIQSVDEFCVPKHFIHKVDSLKCSNFALNTNQILKDS
jgi:hypothetical protein